MLQLNSHEILLFHRSAKSCRSDIYVYIGRIKYLDIQNSHSDQNINNIKLVCIYLSHNHLCSDVMLPVSQNSFKT